MAEELFKMAMDCGLCFHIATEPLQCDKCFQNYCGSCIKLLIQAKTIVDNQEYNEKEDVLLKPFICLNRCIKSKIIIGYDTRINTLKQRRFKFVYADCETIQEWDRMVDHIKKCKSKSNKVRMNISYLPYSFTYQYEKSYESKIE